MTGRGQPAAKRAMSSVERIPTGSPVAVSTTTACAAWCSTIGCRRVLERVAGVHDHDVGSGPGVGADDGGGVAAVECVMALRDLRGPALRIRFLRAGIGGAEGDGALGATRLWWPPAKIAGLYLAPYLYARAGMAGPPSGILAT
jgi:hypothetical protein